MNASRVRDAAIFEFVNHFDYDPSIALRLTRLAEEKKKKKQSIFMLVLLSIVANRQGQER